MYQVCIRYLLCIFIIVCSGTIRAKTQTFELGKHYIKLPNSVRQNEDVKQLFAADKSKIQVVEFFSYGCYWCSKVHLPFKAWSATVSDKVSVYRYPVIFNKMWSVLAQLFYTAQTLDSSGQLDDEIFIAIHEKELQLWREPMMKKFFATRGIEKEKFESVYKSFAINLQLSRAEEIARAYQIDATPNIIINGPTSSFATNLTMTNDVPTLFEVVNFIIEKEIQSLSKKG